MRVARKRWCIFETNEATVGFRFGLPPPVQNLSGAFRAGSDGENRQTSRPSDPLSRNASLRSGVAARGRDREREGAGEDAENVSALFVFAVRLSQNCMTPQSGK